MSATQLVLPIPLIPVDSLPSSKAAEQYSEAGQSVSSWQARLRHTYPPWGWAVHSSASVQLRSSQELSTPRAASPLVSQRCPGRHTALLQGKLPLASVSPASGAASGEAFAVLTLCEEFAVTVAPVHQDDDAMEPAGQLDCFPVMLSAVGQDQSPNQACPMHFPKPPEGPTCRGRVKISLRRKGLVNNEQSMGGMGCAFPVVPGTRKSQAATRQGAIQYSVIIKVFR